MRGPDEIVALYNERRLERGRMHQKRREIRDAYGGDLVLPMPELENDEATAVANLVQSGVDGHAQRIASTLPDLRYPPARPGFKGSEDEARTRRRVSLGWWEQNGIRLVMARRARHLIAYAESPVIVRPDPTRCIPSWQVRDPLDAYPAPSHRLDDFHPVDCVFAVTRPLAWVRRHYGGYLGFMETTKNRPDTPVTVLEYIDAEEHALIAVGHGQGGADPTRIQADYGVRGNTIVETSTSKKAQSYRWMTVLERSRNLAGVCTAVVPGRVTLDRLQGQFDGMIGKYKMQARLSSLELLAIEEGIFPNQWLVGVNGRNPQVIVQADGRKGILGQINDGTIVDSQLNPGYKTDQAIDRLERAQRLEGAIPAEMGGESASNIRTGRRGDAVLAAAIDFSIQEAQEIFAASLAIENTVGIEVSKGYFGAKQVAFDVDWKGARGPVTYKPNELFDGANRAKVRYALAGSDANGQIIRNAQKVGTGLISKQTAREQDAEIEDAELEADRIVAEGIEAALLSSIQTQAADPAGPYQPPDLARITELVVTGRSTLYEAIQKVQQEAQERQAAEAEAAAPEAQPGLAMPGMGVEVPAAIPEPEASVTNLSSMLGQLRRPQLALPAEQAG